MKARSFVRYKSGNDPKEKDISLFPQDKKSPGSANRFFELLIFELVKYGEETQKGG